MLALIIAAILFFGFGWFCASFVIRALWRADVRELEERNEKLTVLQYKPAVPIYRDIWEVSCGR